MCFIFILKCNLNKITSVIQFLLTDSTHLTFKTNETASKNSRFFFLYQKTLFYRLNMHTLCDYGVILHQKQLKCL